MSSAKFCSAKHGYFDDDARLGCPKCHYEKYEAPLWKLQAENKKLKAELERSYLEPVVG